MSEFKSGFIAIIGRPNVGKSTLMNAILGTKVSITSPKPQTTRWQILGIKTLPHAQLVFIDTPGMHDDNKRAMNRYLNRVANSVVDDADIIIFMVDADQWYAEDDLALKRIQRTEKPIVVVLNKIDAFESKAEALPVIEKLNARIGAALSSRAASGAGSSDFSIVPISALKSENIDTLENELIKLLPEGELMFPEEQVTDKNERFQIAEIIREKLIQQTEEELPYTTTVEIEQIVEGEKLTEISAVIWVERDGQKAIVIGKGGEKLKKIGTYARRDIERLLDKKIFLRLWVKVKEHWTDDDRALRSLGYE